MFSDTHNKIKVMRFFFYKIGILLLLLSLPGAGCHDDEYDPSCFKGKVVMLNTKSGCQNIIEIVGTIKNGDLPVGATLSFNPELYGSALKIGDVVYFKVIVFEEFGNIIMPAYCSKPQYSALVEFCIN
jgi:hypothetical protein